MRLKKLFYVVAILIFSAKNASATGYECKPKHIYFWVKGVIQEKNLPEQMSIL